AWLALQLRNVGPWDVDERQSIQLDLAQRTHAPSVAAHYPRDADSRRHRRVVTLVRSRGTAREPAEPGTDRALPRQGIDADVHGAQRAGKFRRRSRWTFSRGARWCGQRALPQQPGARRTRATVRAPRAESGGRSRRHVDPGLVRGGP